MTATLGRRAETRRTRPGRGAPVASAVVAPAGSQSAPRPRTVPPAPLGRLLEQGPPGLRLADGSPPIASGGASPDPRATPLTGASIGSADVRPGDLFAALQGARSHGIEYLDAAVAAGAAAVLTDAAAAPAALARGLPTLVAEDPRVAIGPVAGLIYGEPSAALDVVGITGTSGKTTTSVLLRAGLAAVGVPAGLIGTLGAFCGDVALPSALTTPDAPQLQALLAVLRERGARAVAMEVSSHALALHRVGGVRFAAAGFTNLSQDHLDFHPDMASYFAAKARLFDGRAARHVITVDDDWGRELADAALRAADRTLSATGLAADWSASDVVLDPSGATRFVAAGPAGSFPAGCAIPGSYNMANALLALALLAELGLDPAAAAPAIAAAQVPGRMERIDAGQPFLAVVDYSHKPAAVQGALRALRPLTAGRLIIVLGCGGERDTGKRPLMGEAAARGADVVFVTDDNPRSEDPAAIRSAMLAGARSVPSAQRAQLHESDRRARAIRDALAMARGGDTVLVAGKGHETGQEVDGVTYPFDDRDAVRAALAELGQPPAGAAP
jgi:UDP-N-acetylmuramoyl-L-alanyl-D-glutamate--2,6-diaminopimelate ligase